mmetsp:Transcript_6936/g.10922  ORF Transcript_6936/g.10922 Transcript_6936/m.10922 type:complete len:228 (-) Transcript_6936:16-699(-)
MARLRLRNLRNNNLVSWLGSYIHLMCSRLTSFPLINVSFQCCSIRKILSAYTVIDVVDAMILVLYQIVLQCELLGTNGIWANMVLAFTVFSKIMSTKAVYIDENVLAERTHNLTLGDVGLHLLYLFGNFRRMHLRVEQQGLSSRASVRAALSRTPPKLRLGEDLAKRGNSRSIGIDILPLSRILFRNRSSGAVRGRLSPIYLNMSTGFDDNCSIHLALIKEWDQTTI